jgi:hypothetical protein
MKKLMLGTAGMDMLTLPQATFWPDPAELVCYQCRFRAGF